VFIFSVPLASVSGSNKQSHILGITGPLLRMFTLCVYSLESIFKMFSSNRKTILDK